MTDVQAEGDTTAGDPAPGHATAGDAASDGFTAAPSRVSAAVVVALSVVAASALIGRLGPALAVALALAHAVAFAGSLWLVGRDRWRATATASAGLLALVVGASFAAAVGYTFLDLVAALYPVQTVDQIRPRGLRVASATVVVFGGTVAMVGALSTLVGRLTTESAWAYAKLAVKTFVVPLAVAGVLLISTLLSRLGESDEASTPAPPGSAVGDVVDAFLAPVPGRTHLLTFCLLLATAALAVARAVDALPIAELSTPETDDRVERTVETIERVARRAALVAAAVLPLTLVELAVPPSALRGVLTPPVYGVLAGVTVSPLLRVLLVGTALVAGGTAALVWSLKRSTRTETGDVVVALTPFVGGAAVVVLAAALHGIVLSPTLAFVADALPGQFATAFTRQSTAVVDYYGSLAVVVTVTAVLVGMTAALSLALALVMAIGVLPESAPGPALAAAGTFVAAGFAAGSGVGAPVVLGALVASVVVWDAGEFGATLGREVGRTGASATPEIVHVAAALAVGASGALGAIAVYRVATGTVLTDVTTIPFAISAVVAALVLLVAALR
ncbi:hypothetical protein ACFQMA_20260 [Halosimplex aquaticum]|uniref:Uncharacterized protein n=1 Tax=Halosimplex aquaticum TaxID=3026162 RepID=A0ABD5Y9F7_9EURY|nr:hypothetical protein [Halosimplex aquaticum]